MILFGQAVNIAKDCARINRMVGSQAVYPYTVEQVAEAAMVIWNELSQQVDDLKAAVATANRQTAAANARVAKLEKNKHGPVDHG